MEMKHCSRRSTWARCRSRPVGPVGNPAAKVSLEGSTVSGMAFTLFDGRATLDLLAKLPSSVTNNPGAGGSGTGSTSTGNVTTNERYLGRGRCSDGSGSGFRRRRCVELG